MLGNIKRWVWQYSEYETYTDEQRAEYNNEALTAIDTEVIDTEQQPTNEEEQTDEFSQFNTQRNQYLETISPNKIAMSDLEFSYDTQYNVAIIPNTDPVYNNY